jgi:flagellar motor switch protein FliN/FliY
MSQNRTAFGIDTYYAIWAESAASVLSQLAGGTLQAEVVALREDAFQLGYWLTFTLSGGLSGEQVFWFSPADALHLAQSSAAQPFSADAEFTSEHGNALAQLMQNIAGTVALQLTQILGSEQRLQFKDTDAPSQSLQGGKAVSLRLSTEPVITIVGWVDASLLKSLTPREEQTGLAEASSESTRGSLEGVASAVTPISTDKNLDFLLNLQLDVSIRFGQRQMLLKDVLELGPGAVVELDRRTQDPIELILAGRVIARGEAVVIDGNYGIRVLEVLPPAQRLAELA